MADVFRRHGVAYRTQYGARMAMAQKRAMRAIEVCRTAALGGHVSRCDHCAQERIHYNSCRNRHCPQCQGLDKATADGRHLCVLLVEGEGSLPAMINTCPTWPYILLYPRDGDGYGQARILAYHGSTFNVNAAHCHPHITPDSEYVMYTSDTTGYANIYLVEIGDVGELLELRI
jgi:hypothetical protein